MKDMIESAMIPELRRVLKRLHYPLEVMLVCARWYAAYPLSFGKTPSPRHLEEMMQERGVFVDHSTVHRWALKILPVMALIFRRRSAQSVPVGEWMRPISKLLASGSIVSVRSSHPLSGRVPNSS
jgi:transposase-like protein